MCLSVMNKLIVKMVFKLYKMGEEKANIFGNVITLLCLLLYCHIVTNKKDNLTKVQATDVSNICSLDFLTPLWMTLS